MNLYISGITKLGGNGMYNEQCGGGGVGSSSISPGAQYSKPHIENKHTPFSIYMYLAIEFKEGNPSWY